MTVEIRRGDVRRRVLAALDSCSNNTNIDADLAKELGLPVICSNIPREVHFLERCAQITSDFVKFNLSPLGSETTFELSGFTVKDLMKTTPVADWKEAAKAYPHLQEAEIPTTKPSDRVQILIGTDYAELITPHRVLRGPRGSGAPVAELTDLGWAFSGRTNKKRQQHSAFQVGCSFSHLSLTALGTSAQSLETKPCCLGSPEIDQPVGNRENSLGDNLAKFYSHPLPCGTGSSGLTKEDLHINLKFDLPATSPTSTRTQTLGPEKSLDTCRSILDLSIKELEALLYRAKNHRKLLNKDHQELEKRPLMSRIGDRTSCGRIDTSRAFKVSAAQRVGEIPTNSEHIHSSEEATAAGNHCITARELKFQPLWWGDPPYTRLRSGPLCATQVSRTSLMSGIFPIVV